MIIREPLTAMRLNYGPIITRHQQLDCEWFITINENYLYAWRGDNVDGYKIVLEHKLKVNFKTLTLVDAVKLGENLLSTLLCVKDKTLFD